MIELIKKLYIKVDNVRNLMILKYNEDKPKICKCLSYEQKLDWIESNLKKLTNTTAEMIKDDKKITENPKINKKSINKEKKEDSSDSDMSDITKKNKIRRQYHILESKSRNDMMDLYDDYKGHPEIDNIIFLRKNNEYTTEDYYVYLKFKNKVYFIPSEYPKFKYVYMKYKGIDPLEESKKNSVIIMNAREMSNAKKLRQQQQNQNNNNDNNISINNNNNNNTDNNNNDVINNNNNN